MSRLRFLNRFRYWFTQLRKTLFSFWRQYLIFGVYVSPYAAIKAQVGSGGERAGDFPSKTAL